MRNYYVFMGAVLACYASLLPLSAVAQEPYLRKWIPSLTQCRVLDDQLLVSGGDPYLIAECDTASTKERSLRIWHARYKPNTPSKMLDLSIVGEVILPWRPVNGLFSTGADLKERSRPSYWLVRCSNETQNGVLEESELNSAAFVRVNSSRATANNVLLLFKEGPSGELERLPFSKATKCVIPEE
jgi:hypothetical protein